VQLTCPGPAQLSQRDERVHALCLRSAPASRQVNANYPRVFVNVTLTSAGALDTVKYCHYLRVGACSSTHHRSQCRQRLLSICSAEDFPRGGKARSPLCLTFNRLPLPCYSHLSCPSNIASLYCLETLSQIQSGERNER